MGIITGASLTTMAGLTWKYWRVVWRLACWLRRGEVPQPVLGQIWREAGLSPKNKDWKVVRLESHYLDLQSTTEKDFMDSPLEVRVPLVVWQSEWLGRRRLYCANDVKSAEDRFWGEHSED